MTDFYKEALGMKDQLVEWRHTLHQMPELSLELPKTSAFVQEQLTSMGIPFKTLVNGNCVVATLGKPGKCIMLRADMDGLPVEEESGEPFASTNGCMHACGHDLHTTSLLGAAKILKEHEPELAGTVKLFFQPAEETFLGADAAIKDGVLEDPHVDVAYGQHVIGQVPMGVIVYGPGEMMAGVYGFRIKIQGRGGHGSMPNACIDPITAGVHVHLALQELMSREVSGLDHVVLTVGKFQAGNAANVIADTAELEGTLRVFDPKLREYMIKRIAEVSKSVAETYRCTAEVETLSDCPAQMNDADLTEACRSYVSAAMPEVAMMTMPAPAMGSEDFAFVSEKVPSTYMVVGAAVEDTDVHYVQHHPKIRFSDNALVNGAAAYAAIGMGWLADNE